MTASSSDSKIERRRFLRYVGASAGLVAATGLGYLATKQWRPFYDSNHHAVMSPAKSSTSPPISVTSVTESSTSTATRWQTSDNLALEIVYTRRICKLTGEDSINNTSSVGIYGTDLGVMAELNGEMYFAFGDTFDKDWRKARPQDLFWRSNVLAKTTDFDASNGVVFDSWVTDHSGKAKEILSSRKIDGDEVTVIPTALVSVDDRLFIHYMSVRKWLESGNWTVNYSGLAYSDNKGESFTKDPQARWSARSNFTEAAFAKVPSENGDGTNDILMWGTPAGRFGGAKLAKVNEHSLLDRKQYSYFGGVDNGAPRWIQNENEAVTVIDGPVGEMSVQYNEFLERWIITYLKEGHFGVGAIVIRESKKPWGPWSDPHALVLDGGMYGPFMHPRYSENNGERLYFTLSSWEEYNVYLYEATLVRRT